jgi:TonB family protein
MRNTRLPVANSFIAQTVALAIAVALLLGRSALLGQDSADKTSDTVYEAGDVGTAPKAVYHPDPTYVDRARRKKINGSVIVTMVVTAEGRARDLKITKSLDKDLDKQAIKAVSTWKFEPATKDGKPVAVRVPVEVTFKLY